MRGNGNSVGTLLQKLWFFVLPTAGLRSRYIYKHENQFHHIGRKILWQPRSFPTDPEYISVGNNVRLASGVQFINHDTAREMLNRMYETDTFASVRGCIQVGDNVMVGANTLILPNVRIGNNVVVGAGSVVTRDIPSNSVAAGVPCRVIGTFDNWVEKRKKTKDLSGEALWEEFYQQRKT